LGVGFFFFPHPQKNPTNPTLKGSVREPGSRTLPQVNPIEILYPTLKGLAA
jgi:hypothetical protein